MMVPALPTAQRSFGPVPQMRCSACVVPDVCGDQVAPFHVMMLPPLATASVTADVVHTSKIEPVRLVAVAVQLVPFHWYALPAVPTAKPEIPEERSSP